MKLINKSLTVAAISLFAAPAVLAQENSCQVLQIEQVQTQFDTTVKACQKEYLTGRNYYLQDFSEYYQCAEQAELDKEKALNVIFFKGEESCKENNDA